MANIKEEPLPLDIILVFGQKKIPIHLELSSDDESKFITVEHLSNKVYKETKVEPSCQKLIYKGKALFKTDDTNSLKEPISAFGIHNGDRIMLLARKLEPADAAEKPSQAKKKKDSEVIDQQLNEVDNTTLQQRLEDVQSEVEKICLRCDELVKDSRRISESLALKSCKRSFVLLHEDSMKLLERVDAIHSSNNEEARKLKKSIVGSLQVQLDICEKEIGDLSQKLLDD
ncbi:BAG family molecular chaperone regulator 1 [Biomphalaria glabrata]|nr:BAG family molecular chaperone regulator 1 [Biomphalaria glabrata]